MNQVTVIDYGIANLANVVRALEHVGGKVEVASDPDKVLHSSRIILPGVGAFGPGMMELKTKGLDEAIISAVKDGVPLLGICLGMQMLFESSRENGWHEGLAIIPGEIVPIPARDSHNVMKRKVPHIGWSELVSAEADKKWGSTCLAGTSNGDFVYFVHSFMAAPRKANDVLAQCFYVGLPITAVVSCENVAGVQFHPERSGPVGLQILRSFLSH